MSSTIQKKTYTVVITIDEEDGRFVGRCDELRACSFGNTFGEIMENMREAVGMATDALGVTSDFNMLIIEK